jgi:hypothetical protein
MSLHILTVYGSWHPQLFGSKTNMDSVRKITLHSRLWIASAAAALSIGTWSIAPEPASADVVIGGGIPFPLYAQYPYYPYPPAYYPYYPPPAPAYPPAPSYTHQPTYTQSGRSGGNIARQLNQQELNRLQAAPVNRAPPPFYPPPPPRY